MKEIFFILGNEAPINKDKAQVNRYSTLVYLRSLLNFKYQKVMILIFKVPKMSCPIQTKSYYHEYS